MDNPLQLSSHPSIQPASAATGSSQAPTPTHLVGAHGQQEVPHAGALGQAPVAEADFGGGQVGPLRQAAGVQVLQAGPGGGMVGSGWLVDDVWAASRAQWRGGSGQCKTAGLNQQGTAVQLRHCAAGRRREHTSMARV